MRVCATIHAMQQTGLEIGVGSDFGVGSGSSSLPTHVGSGMLRGFCRGVISS